MLAYTKRIFVVPALFSFIFTQAIAQTDDNTRFMDWSKSGADLSVRDKFQKEYNVRKYGILPDGKTDNSKMFRKLLAKVKPFSIIKFPAGTYLLKSSFDIPSNIIIRGDGIGKTIIHFKPLKLGQRGCFHSSSFDRLDKAFLKKPAKVGDTEIFLENISNYQKGDVIDLNMANDADLMYTQERWNASWAANARGQIMEVKEIKAATNSIVVTTPVRLDYELKDKPFCHRQNGFTNIGYEDFTIENFQTEDLMTFYFRAARNCWVMNVHSINSVKAHVFWESSSKCSLLNSYLRGAFKVGGGGQGYGVVCSNHTTDCRVENNIMTDMRHSMMVKKGSNGNAFLYNYSFDGRWDHLPRAPSDVSIHGHYSYMNLFEGNIVERITSADFWGPSGPGTTFFRNVVTNDNIEIKDKSVKQNVIGNKILNPKAKLKIADENVQPINENNTIAKAVGEDKYPVSLVYTTKPKYFSDAEWPIVNKETNAARLRYENTYKNLKTDGK